MTMKATKIIHHHQQHSKSIAKQQQQQQQQQQREQSKQFNKWRKRRVKFRHQAQPSPPEMNDFLKSIIGGRVRSPKQPLSTLSTLLTSRRGNNNNNNNNSMKREARKQTVRLAALLVSIHFLAAAGATFVNGNRLPAASSSTTSTSITTKKSESSNVTTAATTTTTTTTIALTIPQLKIPTLYDGHENPWQTPLQGQENFERSILNGSQLEGEQTVNLIQYYMATCPDCQGFSPYFKRFVWDIGPHWRHLVRIYTINCNDEININLCWQQNPNLIVPLVRWYTFASVQIDSRRAHNERRFADYPADLLNVAHRGYIKKQRRDLISLRHATLRYIVTILDHLSSSSSSSSLSDQKQAAAAATDKNSSTLGFDVDRDEANGGFYAKLPIRWKLLRPLGGGMGEFHKQQHQPRRLQATKDEATARFLDEIIERTKQCERALNSNSNANSTRATIENFIVFERPGSFVGKTLVADWSNWTCSSEQYLASAHWHAASRSLFMFHHSDNLSLLKGLEIVDEKKHSHGSAGGGPKISIDYKDAVHRQPLLASFRTSSSGGLPASLGELEFHLLAANHSSGQQQQQQQHHSPARLRRHVASKMSDHQHNQRLSLEKYYASRKFRDPMARNSYRYSSIKEIHAQTTAATAAAAAARKRIRRSEATVGSSSSSSTTTGAPVVQSTPPPIDFNEAENINWGPEYIYPGEESLRYRFNSIIGHKIKSILKLDKMPEIPGAQFEGQNPGEIPRSSNVNRSAIIQPKDDDLTLLRLTDYYKVLDEIMHKNILSRAQIDGYQLTGMVCFVRQLSRRFPFQGSDDKQKSISRHYLELLYQKFNDLLNKQSSSANSFQFDGCSGYLTGNQKKDLEAIRVSSKELQAIQAQTRQEYDIGLPSEGHFKWQYCAGSSEFLRGHTCSLWILFHTLTVHEYLAATAAGANSTHHHQQQQHGNCTISMLPAGAGEQKDDDLLEYKFKIKYTNSTRDICDPSNPEPALVNSKSADLFQEPTSYTLANIINFVRYYLSCTNCAAHFSCMVHNSPGLTFCKPKRPDDHLLWLWEAHNRVNVRTRSSHSEDPTRPKHVFPVYEACPECYLEKPTNQTQFERMKFNRAALVEFIVARYRKSAILNNKIKIEDLFRKQVPTMKSSGSSSSSIEGSNGAAAAADGSRRKSVNRALSLIM